MKALLVQPLKNFGIPGESYPPVGLGYLATAVRKGGHSVDILDCLKENYNEHSFIRKVKDISPHLIGFNLFSISVPFVEMAVGMIKDEMPDTIVVLGGPHVSSLPNRILNYFKKVDFAIRGEGEIPLRQLTDYLDSGKRDFSGIPGLIYRKNGEILINEPYFAKNIEDYDNPAWDLINPPEYFKYLSVGPYSAPVFLSRGCPFSCTFCAAKVTSGQSLRRRSLDHIFQELDLLQNKYGIKRFIIEDEGFGVDKSFIMDFCQRIRKENYKARFAMGLGMRVDIIDRELLENMQSCNFEKILVLGIESGSERILKLMKKKIDLEMVREKVNLMDKMGLEPNGFFILGYPDETRQEMEETVRLALKLPLREASFTAFQPLPGTEATRILIENKELPENFDFSGLVSNTIAYAPRGMKLRELERIRKMAILRFYLRPKILIRYFSSWRAFVYAFKKAITVFLKKNIPID